jgi:hypothetical protein
VKKSQGPYGLSKAITSRVPVRVPVREEEADDGTVVLIYRKTFTRMEGWIYRHFGGHGDIRRPLDEMGTDIWKLCDGEHNIGEICTIMHKQYGENLQPVGPRVWGFIKILAQRNLVLVIRKKVPLVKKEEDEDEQD